MVRQRLRAERAARRARRRLYPLVIDPETGRVYVDCDQLDFTIDTAAMRERFGFGAAHA